MQMTAWSRILDALGRDIGESNIQKWFHTSAFAIESERAILCAPNKFAKNWIEENYRETLERKIIEVTGLDLKLEINVGSPEQMSLPGFVEKQPEKKAHKARKKQVCDPELKYQLNPRYTFDNFVVGASNQFAQAACKSVAEKPAKTYNPLFIYGDVGLGKTHLLNAIGHYMCDSDGPCRIRYTNSESFMNEMISSMRFDKMGEFRKKFREDVDVLLMDDVQFLAGKERTQEEFFHTFNALFDGHKQIVLSSNQYPKEIAGLDERLVSRLVWGLIVDIQPPDLETKLAILSRKAQENNFQLSQELALFLAANLGSNVRELEGSLTRIFAYASLSKVEATPELAREALRNVLGKQQALTVEQIQKIVAGFFNIKVSDLKSQRKMKLIAHPRQICMYLARKHTSSSFPEIGAKFGGKDHSTVIHAVKRIEQKIEEDATLRNMVETIEKNLCV